MEITAELTAITKPFGEPGRLWLENLPGLVGALLDRWSLTFERTGPETSCSYVAVVRRGTEPFMLKVPIPHPEAEHEADALEIWAGEVSVGLVERDTSGAMLLELADPGTPLADHHDPSEAARIGGRLLARLLRPAPDEHPIDDLATVCAAWAVLMRERARDLDDDELVQVGARLLETLPHEADERVLLHGDFHHWNVLQATREPWLTIDPKPMVGDPDYDGAQFLANHYGVVHRDVELFANHARIFADAAGLDFDRVRRWGIARNTESAMWSLAKGDRDGCESRLAYAAVLRDLA